MTHRRTLRPTRGHRVGTVVATVAAATLLVAPVAHAKTVTVTKSGKSITVNKGDRVVVKVAENPSTGFGWKTVRKPSFLRLLSSTYKATPTDSEAPVVGSGGTRTFTYSAKAKGTGTLKLSYQRGSDTTGAKLFSLKVTVR